MRFKVEWHQQDLEQMLRESLQRSNLFIPQDQQFRWHFRPKLRVTIEVEPERAASENVPKTVEDVCTKAEKHAADAEKTEFDTWDPALLPSGVNVELLKQLERAARRDKK